MLSRNWRDNQAYPLGHPQTSSPPQFRGLWVDEELVSYSQKLDPGSEYRSVHNAERLLGKPMKRVSSRSNVLCFRGPFILAMAKTWCPDHFNCANSSCRRSLMNIGFVEEKGQLYCEICFESYFAPNCCKCGQKVKAVSWCCSFVRLLLSDNSYQTDDAIWKDV